ncbi:MAG: hypothetical protein MSC31_17565 [Solirubrobacteraceae bacterium MAG38_C4-C5]|nr:hypothetical protein [Candidatus Siliceabacter maunaloa]
MATTLATTMECVHELAVQEFGRLAPPLAHDDSVQLLHLPGGEFAVVVLLSSPETLTVRKAVARGVDFERPGLADFLMREHAELIFGRFERVEENTLSVEHSVFAEAITGSQLARVALAVHEAALGAYKTLLAVGVIDEEDGAKS